MCECVYFQSEIIIALLKDYVSQLSSEASKRNVYFCTPESGSDLFCQIGTSQNESGTFEQSIGCFYLGSSVNQ